MINFDFSAVHGSGWFPGHMRKAIRQFLEKLKMVDLVAILVDARAPQASLNTDLMGQIENKPILIVMNKTDLANKAETEKWRQEFRNRGYDVLMIQANKKVGMNKFKALVPEIIERDRKDKGCTRALFRPKRILICGTPNIGKSTLINALVGKNKTKTGPKPGVTKHQQWANISKELEVLDTPGIMPPGNPGPENELKLGLINVIKQSNLGEDFLAMYLLYRLIIAKRGDILEKIKADPSVDDGLKLLQTISINNGHLRLGGEADLHKTAIWLLSQFNRGAFGSLSLDILGQESEAFADSDLASVRWKKNQD